MSSVPNRPVPAKTTPKLNISACILTKNDESLIEDCLKSVAKIAREIIVIDLGSTDKTVNIARKYTSRLFRHPWNHDFSEVRNAFFKYVSSDWVLYLDAHERLTEESQKLLTTGFLDKKSAGYIVKVVEMFQDREVECFSVRIFRRTKDIRFKWVLHESVADDVQNLARRDGLNIVRTDLVINRYNYLKYFDDADIHRQFVDIARHGLENPNLDFTVRLYYQLCEGLSLNSLGEHDEAENKLNGLLSEVRKFDKKTIYNIPMFMQAYLYFGFRLSKQGKYEDALRIIREGVEIYHNSLTMLIRYCELLYANKMYKECLDHIAKIIMLQEEELYYQLEPVDFAMVNKLANKLEDLAFEKYQAAGMGR